MRVRVDVEKVNSGSSLEALYLGAWRTRLNKLLKRLHARVEGCRKQVQKAPFLAAFPQAQELELN